MAELISKLGIDWKLLIAQIINFLVLLAILYKFLYRPVLELMQKRTKRIEDGLNKAKEIEEELAKTREDYKNQISRAKKEANEILARAETLAKGKEKEFTDRAKEQITRIVNREKVKLGAEKEKTIKEIKSEVADLVAVSLEKILGQTLDAKRDEKLIDKMIKKTE